MEKTTTERAEDLAVADQIAGRDCFCSAAERKLGILNTPLFSIVGFFDDFESWSDKADETDKKGPLTVNSDTSSSSEEELAGLQRIPPSVWKGTLNDQINNIAKIQSDDTPSLQKRVTTIIKDLEQSLRIFNTASDLYYTPTLSRSICFFCLSKMASLLLSSWMVVLHFASGVAFFSRNWGELQIEDAQSVRIALPPDLLFILNRLTDSF